MIAEKREVIFPFLATCRKTMHTCMSCNCSQLLSVLHGASVGKMIRQRAMINLRVAGFGGSYECTSTAALCE